LKAFISEVGETELTEDQLAGLYHKYGDNSIQIIEKIHLKAEDRKLAILSAELEYVVENEMITELSDFLIRRTGRLYFERPIADKYAEVLNEKLAELIDMDDKTKKDSLATYLKESKEVLTFVK
jgi:glycerol-3-phosphate dehydrogenase